MIAVPRSEHYADSGDAYPCVVCGKTVSRPKYMVHLHDGGSSLVTEEEAATMDPSGDMGAYPIGPDCLRKHPEVKPYVMPA